MPMAIFWNSEKYVESWDRFVSGVGTVYPVGITRADPGVVTTATSHGFSGGATVQFSMCPA